MAVKSLLDGQMTQQPKRIPGERNPTPTPDAPMRPQGSNG